VPTVSDSSPLIWLSKIGILPLLKTLYTEVIIPEEVYKEVVTNGLREGFSDALVIKECINQGWIKVKELDESDSNLCNMITENAPEIHKGETEAILLAHSNNMSLLMDDSCGRALAETWGVKVQGTLYVILKSLREAIIDKDEAKEAVSRMIKKGFRIDPRLYIRILEEIHNYDSI
jgi:predicted nucleic acid-binding protein